MTHHFEVPPQLSPEQVSSQINEKAVAIIDVRDPRKYQQEHLPGAISIPSATLTAEQLPEGKTVILYCGSGNSAGRTMERLRNEGHTNVASLEGGITAWKSAGLLTTKSLELYTPEEVKSAVAERYGHAASHPDQKFNFPVGRCFAESVGYEATMLDQFPSSLWESFSMDSVMCRDHPLCRHSRIHRSPQHFPGHLWFGGERNSVGNVDFPAAIPIVYPVFGEGQFPVDQSVSL